MAKHAIEAGDKALISDMKRLTKVYKCKEEGCSKEFHYKEGLDGHMIVEHGREDLKWQCKLCTASYIHKRHHDRHMREKHLLDKHGNTIATTNHLGDSKSESKSGNNPGKKQSKKTKIVKSEPETGINPSKKQSKKTKIVKTNHLNDSKSGPKAGNDPGKKQSKKTGCKICFAKFNTRLELDSHMVEEHQHKGNWTCKECQSKFIMKRHLYDHMLKIHEMDKDGTKINVKNGLFKYSFCSDEFATKSKLDSHLVQDHGQERSHQCDLCGVKERIFNL